LKSTESLPSTPERHSLRCNFAPGSGPYPPATTVACSLCDVRVVYRQNYGVVYRKSTVRRREHVLLRAIRGLSILRAYYHQQYLAKNPNGYCGIGGCGVPFKLAELQVGETP